MVRNVLLTLIGLSFVALSIFLMAVGKEPWTSPDPWSGLLFFAGCAVVGIADIVSSQRPAAPEVTAERVVLRYERLRMGALGLVGAGWFAAGVIGLWGTVFPAWLAWMLAAFGGLVAVVLLPIGLDGRPKVVVDAQGIADYRRLTRKIAWGDLSAISYSTASGMPTVELRLNDSHAYLDKRPSFGRLLGHTIDPLHINTFNLDGTLADILAAIERFAPPELVPEPAGDQENGNDAQDEL